MTEEKEYVEVQLSIDILVNKRRVMLDELTALKNKIEGINLAIAVLEDAPRKRGNAA